MKQRETRRKRETAQNNKRDSSITLTLHNCTHTTDCRADSALDVSQGPFPHPKIDRSCHFVLITPPHVIFNNTTVVCQRARVCARVKCLFSASLIDFVFA